MHGAQTNTPPVKSSTKTGGTNVNVPLEPKRVKSGTSTPTKS